MKTAIVTGAAGFIGRKLTERLLRNDWFVFAIDDLSTHDTWDYGSPRLLKYTTRIQNWDRAPSEGIDAIFHLAGKVGPVGVLRYAGEIAIDTISSADAVGRLAAKYKCPLIYTSTSEVYGSPDDSNWENTPKVFQGPPSARQEYASSRFAAEVMLQNRDIDVRIIRPFNVVGAGQSASGGFVIPRFVQQALRGEPITVYTPGRQQRAFTHVNDITDGMYAAYLYGDAGEVYNLGNAMNACSILQLAWEVEGMIDTGVGVTIVDPKTLHGPKFREAPDKLPNADKAMEKLNWLPLWSREEIIYDVIKYEKERSGR